MAWIRSTNLQDGTPVTRRIKIPDMGKAIWFTDKGYAEVSDTVATLLVNNLSTIESVATPPTSPGTYYGDVGSQQEQVVVFPRDDKYIDDLNANTATVGTLTYDHTQSYPHYPNQPVVSSAPSFVPHPAASNPVLTAEDVTDAVNVSFVADPFVAYENGVYHLFFELAHDPLANGVIEADIGHATSPDGLNWTYDSLTSVTQGHDAYPYVFKDNGEWFMAPDNGKDNTVEIWRATNFPLQWSLEQTILSGRQFTDPTIVKWEGTWYLWAFENTPSSTAPQTVLFYANNLLGQWSEHPSSPVAQDNRIQRPAGRPIVRDDVIDIWYMDNRATYGDQIRSYRVTDLSPTSYTQTELATSPVAMAEQNDSWNSKSMHHIDPIESNRTGSPLIITDGRDANDQWSIGVLTVSQKASSTARLGVASGTSVQTVPDNGGVNDGRAIFPWSQVSILNAVEHDTDRVADAATNSITIPRSGYWTVEAAVDFNIPTTAAPATGTKTFRVASRIHDRTSGRELTNSDSTITLTPDHTTNSRDAQTLVTNAYLEEGATLSLDVYQNSGADLTIIANSGQTHLTTQRIR